jgi:hypothetical protein
MPVWSRSSGDAAMRIERPWGEAFSHSSLQHFSPDLT